MTDGTMDLAMMISRRLKALDWQQKHLAHEWHKASGKKLNSSTFESRLSNLMNDEEDGYAFVTDASHGNDRLMALASCLGVEVAALRALVESTRRRPTIVFDEHVPENQRVFFEKRAARFPLMLRCATANGEPNSCSARERLRDIAKKYRNAFVVVGTTRDGDFYAGAGVRTTRIQAIPKGFSIPEVPDISLQCPARTVDDDGMILVGDDEVEAWYRSKGRDSFSREDDDAKWLKAIAEADADERPVTFRHDWLMKRRGCRPPTAEEIGRAALTIAAASANLGENYRQGEQAAKARHSLDFLWWHGGRVLGFPEYTYFRDRAAPVAVHNVVTFAPVVEKLRNVFTGMNPCAMDDPICDLSAELAAFADETGLVVEITANSVRNTFREWTQCQGTLEKGGQVHRGPEHDARVRECLDEILDREFELPLEKASVIWMLELVRRAPLLHGAISENEMQAIADIGTGNILRFVIQHFASEKPTAMRYLTLGREASLEGGNVRMTWRKLFDETLEGTSLKVVERRREEARHAAEAADDD